MLEVWTLFENKITSLCFWHIH